MASPAEIDKVLTRRAGKVVGVPGLRWETSYRTAVLLTDLLIIGLALRVGLYLLDGSLYVAAHLRGALGALTGTTLVLALLVCRAWESPILGQGAEEFRRLGTAVMGSMVVLGLTALAAGIPNVRPWVFAVLPAAGGSLVLSRFTLRKILHMRRARNRCMLPVLAAGGVDEVALMIERTRQERHNGWSVAAVCVPGGVGEGGDCHVRGVPVIGALDDVADLAGNGGYRVVAVAPDAHWTRHRLRQLAWELEDTSADLVVAPALMEVAGPRLHVAPVYGLTLLRVSKPVFTGARWIVKAVFDRFAAAVLLAVVAPVLLAVALAIKIEDRGPVLFRQARVGRSGATFGMLKFRSMVVDAESRRADLASGNEAAGPLFKLRTDPRVTRVGAVLRRYSLDELPQLINVLTGSMSLVGPRPPLPAEVERYGTDALRRLLVKPGLTGLWQVSGRSDLSWEETVRLDLRYVENWSFALDAVILWKTAGAVMKGRGAY